MCMPSWFELTGLSCSRCLQLNSLIFCDPGNGLSLSQHLLSRIKFCLRSRWVDSIQVSPWSNPRRPLKPGCPPRPWIKMLGIPYEFCWFRWCLNQINYILCYAYIAEHSYKIYIARFVLGYYIYSSWILTEIFRDWLFTWAVKLLSEISLKLNERGSKQ